MKAFLVLMTGFMLAGCGTPKVSDPCESDLVTYINCLNSGRIKPERSQKPAETKSAATGKPAAKIESRFQSLKKITE